MKAVTFQDINDLRLVDLPTPTPGLGEALLRVHTAGICMTDYHIVQGHFPVTPPRVLGHEITGSVEAVGDDVDPSWIGKTVVVAPARFCGQCAPCRTGAPHLCLNFECLGNTSDGGMAEYTHAQVGQLLEIAGVPPERAVWAEPLACVLRAAEAARASTGKQILVVGAGTLGRLLAQVLQQVMEARVGVVDPNPAKVEASLRSGAEHGWHVPREGDAAEVGAQIHQWSPEGLHAIIDTTGKVVAIERAVNWSVPRTRIVLFGVSEPAARLSLSPSIILGRELTITAVSGMTLDSFYNAVEFLKDSQLDTNGLVERIVSLEEVPAVLEAMASSSSGKVLIQPGLIRK